MTTDMPPLMALPKHEVEELLEPGAYRNTPPEKIQHWYNGYTFGEEIIYNPWSIMCLPR